MLEQVPKRKDFPSCRQRRKPRKAFASGAFMCHQVKIDDPDSAKNFCISASERNGANTPYNFFNCKIETSICGSYIKEFKWIFSAVSMKAHERKNYKSCIKISGREMGGYGLDRGADAASFTSFPLIFKIQVIKCIAEVLYR